MTSGPDPPLPKPRVVIVGAGFGGLAAARGLLGAPVDVTLVDVNNFHTFQPLLYQVATAGLDSENVAHAIRGIVRPGRRRPGNVGVRMARVTGIDLDARQVCLDDGGRLVYDILVIAAGAVSHHFDVPGVVEHSFPLKHLDDALRLRAHVLDRFERAAADPAAASGGALDVVVCGGGPTGVEMAGALRELYERVLAKDFPHLAVRDARIVLVEMADRLLTPFTPKSSARALRTLERRGVEVRLGTGVAAVDTTGVRLTDGTVIPAGTTVWATGVTADPLARMLGTPTGRGGRLVVEPDLSLPGRPEVFAVGDIAATPDHDGTPLPQVAAPAMQGGRHVARQIARLAEGRPTEPFRYRDKGQMATIGRHDAVTELANGWRLSGPIGWASWLALHLVYLMGFRNRINVFVDWSWNYLTYDRASRILRETDRGTLNVPAAAPLRARGLTVVRGPSTVLDSVDLVVASRQRIGVVGPNGVGKSTLLQALAGSVPLERGTVERTPPSATVGYLPQEPSRSEVETVAMYLARRTGVTTATAELEAATVALAADVDGTGDRYAVALDHWLSLGGADLDARIGQVWAELGLSGRLLEQPTDSLSGGEAARAGLAALLLARFDVFLLDEPTNDLDLDGLDRLERWVADLRAPIVLVSHDRTFLARTVTHVVELDEFTHRATHYGGGWQAYIDEREAARRAAWERFEDFDTQRRTLARRAQREREWASQGLSKARKADEPDKNIRAFKINQTEQLAGRAARTERAIERLEGVDKPREPWQLRLQVQSPGRSGDVVARLDGAIVRCGTFQLGPIDLLVGAGERIALVGANGSGKSTLIEALLGRAELVAGRRTVGPSVVVGEVEQARDRLDGQASLLRAFQDLTGSDAGEVRTLLAKFGLVADHVTRPSSTLSPGERTRATLALLMQTGANLLVLDEPTNHLDLPAIEQLEAALDTFDGTVLLVTHDRSLLERVRLTRRVELIAGRISSDAAT